MTEPNETPLAEETIGQVEQPQPSQLEQYLPMSEYNPVNPVSGASYIPDEEYNTWKSTTAQQQATPPEEVVTVTTPAATTEPIVEPVTSVTPAPSFDHNSWLKEKSGGKFETEEDFLNFVKEPVKFQDETSKQLFELLHSGKHKEVVDFYQHQAFLDSVPSMADEDAVKSMLVFQDPEATDADIHYDFINRVGQMPVAEMYDEDSKSEYERDLHQWKRKVKMVAGEARTYLESQRKTFKLPDLPKPAFKGFSNEELATMESDFATGIKSAVETQLGSLSSIKVPVVDKDQGIDFVYEALISEQDKAALKGSFQDYLQDFDTRYGKGNSYDGAKLARDRFIADNFEKIIASASKAAFAKGKLAVINTQSNANVRQVAPPTEFAVNDYLEAGKRFIHGR